MTGHVFELVVHFFVGDVDFFLGGDAVDNELGLDVVLGAIFLTAAQADPVHIDGAGIDTLLR